MPFRRRTEKLLPDLYQLVFAFPDDEYRTRRVPYDPFGGTAHEHMFEAGMAMSCDDDKIGFAIACDVGDYFKDSLEFEGRRDEFNRIAFPGYAAWSTCFCQCIHGLL